MDFFNQPGFWGAVASAFAFLTAVNATARSLIAFHYRHETRSNEEKAKLEMSVDNLKAHNSSKTNDELYALYTKIEPLVKHHEEVVQNLEKSVQGVHMVEEALIKLSTPLNEQFAKFNKVVPQMTASLQMSVDEIAKMKTEIVQLKSGNVFVKTKKEIT